MKNKPLISVIIPVYNVEYYLEKCLVSVINQTYNNLEIIVVNDGSTDKSLFICNKFAEKDHRVVIISQENQGQAQARNNAINFSRGEFITFLDSDDYMHSECIQMLYENLIMTCSDISIVGYKKVNSHNYELRKKRKKKIEVFTSEQALQELFYQKKFDSAPWAKMTKAEIIKSNLFPNGIIYEDLATTYKWFHNSKRICFENTELLAYFNNNKGTMNTQFNAKTLIQIDIVDDIFCFIEKNYPKVLNSIKAKQFSCYSQVLMKIYESKYQNIVHEQKIWQGILQIRKNVFWDKNTRIKNKVAVIISYFGLETYKKFLYLILGAK